MYHCKKILIFIIFILVILPNIAFGVQRFPPPEFVETGHELPKATQPSARSEILEYLDVVVLILTLSIASYLALKKRSRRGLFLLTIFSLLYFGFWRKGCICPVGAVQNVFLSLFDKTYFIPITAVIFFILPLAFSLLFGRVFCASVCPLGAIQDIVLVRPFKVPAWIDRSLSTFAYIFLGAGVLFAGTGSAFIICQYDPFVAFFRRSGNLNILIISISFIIISIFIGRPYCRYLCPYGALLRLTSRGAKWHVSITPDDCIQCSLCEDSCPFGAINKPEQKRKIKENKKLFVIMILLLPILIAGGVFLGIQSGAPLSHVNFKVRLAEQIWLEDTNAVTETTEPSEAFRGTGNPKEALYQEVINIKRKFTIGSGIFGGFVGLVIASKLISLALRNKRTDFEADRSNCISCGRCFAY
ncbi:TPA: 4Fe-4S binding protein, partial [bacterium]|nr:4Fe-4S binding protein [bacterium]